MIKKILLASSVILALAAGISFAKAEDRTDCAFPFSEVMEKNRTSPSIKDFKVEDVPATLQKQIIENLGPPPVSEPYTFALATAEIAGTQMGQLYVHDGECGLVSTNTVDLQQLLSRIGVIQVLN